MFVMKKKELKKEVDRLNTIIACQDADMKNYAKQRDEYYQNAQCYQVDIDYLNKRIACLEKLCFGKN